jgi:hypothetical protein
MPSKRQTATDDPGQQGFGRLGEQGSCKDIHEENAEETEY